MENGTEYYKNVGLICNIDGQENCVQWQYEH